ncbi:MAG: helix-turn-helix transcriptional regulator [Nitrospirae bacterium]|nr:helix-turn-helix transcriptional regulator [Nitrospirota bacterium]
MKKGWKQIDLANAIGLSQAQVNSWFTVDNRNPGKENLKKIAEAFGVKMDYIEQLKDGTIEMTDIDADLTRIGLFKMNVYYFASAGNGDTTDVFLPEHVAQITIPIDLARPNIVAVKIRGQSMEPTIVEGAVCGIDTGDKQIISGKMYACKIPYEGVVIKRVYMGKTNVSLKSDNPAFLPIEFMQEDLDEHFLVGRVRWVWQEYK